MKSSPEDIADAVARFQAGEFTSLGDAERKTGVKRQTISLRLAGSVPSSKAHGFQQKVPPEIEEKLVSWILAEDQAGCPPTFAKLRSIVMDILQDYSIKDGLGEYWHTNFINRYENRIKAVFQRKIDVHRVEDCNDQAINAFFDRLEQIIHKYKIPPCNQYNMDESGLQSYEDGNEKVITSQETPGNTAPTKSAPKAK
jgi:hypothetical protein